MTSPRPPAAWYPGDPCSVQTSWRLGRKASVQPGNEASVHVVQPGNEASVHVTSPGSRDLDPVRPVKTFAKRCFSVTPPGLEVTK